MSAKYSRNAIFRRITLHGRVWLQRIERGPVTDAKGTYQGKIVATWTLNSDESIAFPRFYIRRINPY